jgi:hypothetical protein
MLATKRTPASLMMTSVRLRTMGIMSLNMGLQIEGPSESCRKILINDRAMLTEVYAYHEGT